MNPDEDFRVRVAIKKLVPQAQIPTYANEEGDCALDLYALEPAVIKAGYRQKIKTGIAVELPPGYAGLIVPRSGLTVKHGITVLNTPGLIDSNYRGEIMVVLHNSDPDITFRVNVGARIAQLLVLEVPVVDFVHVDVLSSTVRGDGGFGSTGE